jgi:hypothetical protein
MPVLERLLFAIAGIAIMAGLLVSHAYERNMTDHAVGVPPRGGAANGEHCRDMPVR